MPAVQHQPTREQRKENASMVAIDVQSASKRFGDTQALDGSSLCLRRGEIHALVGENGSGKSTMAKLVSGVFAPDQGSVRIGTTAPTSPGHARDLGVATVFQEVLVADGAPVVDNLWLGHDGFARSRRARAERYSEGHALLSRLLDGDVDLDAPIEALTLSERQWVVIARALLGKPDVLILDEASAALDQASAERLLEELKRQREQGTAVLFVSHRIAELHAIADRATVLRDGSDVGTLERGEITEERLLELMTGQARADRTRTVRPKPQRRIALSVEALELVRDKPFSLDIMAGEILGIAGLEGHGQAEFVRAISGIERALAGTVRAPARAAQVDIRSIRDADRAGVVYVTGDRKREGIVPSMSVLENFALPLMRRQSRLGLIDGRRISRSYREQSSRLAIRARSSALPIRSLSGGNQQKVLIGRALALAPKVIVLNDPTRGVDVGTKHEVYGLLESLAAEGAAVCFLSTELEEFMGVADRVAVFHGGTLERVLDTADISVDKLLAAMFGHQRGSTEAVR
jgi:ribose transport system ATP-binding protein